MATFMNRSRRPACTDEKRGPVGTRHSATASPIIAEFELDLEILTLEEGHGALEVVLRGGRHAHLVALDRRLDLLELRVLDRRGNLLGRLGVERRLELDLARHRVAGRRLDVADVQVLHGY